MSNWLRRMRGAIGMGLVWAAAWFSAGIVLLFIVGFGAADVPFPLFFALLGFLAGILFSGLLGIMEGRRRFEEMSLPRFAGWGAVGGLLLSLPVAAAAGWESLAFLGPLFAFSGAACAAGSLGLARRGEDRELIEASADTDEATRLPHSTRTNRTGPSSPDSRTSQPLASKGR